MQFFFLLYIFTVYVINWKTLMRPEIDLKKKHSSIERKGLLKLLSPQGFQQGNI